MVNILETQWTAFHLHICVYQILPFHHVSVCKMHLPLGFWSLSSRENQLTPIARHQQSVSRRNIPGGWEEKDHDKLRVALGEIRIDNVSCILGLPALARNDQCSVICRLILWLGRVNMGSV